MHYSLATHPTDISLIPGAQVVVQKLQQSGVDLAIATNKAQSSLQRALKSTGLDVFFAVTRSAGQVPAKPCPQMLEEIMDVFGATSAQTLMVGDSVMDMEMARDAGVDAIGVDFYHQQADDLRAAGALEVFDDYEQLASYLLLPKE